MTDASPPQPSRRQGWLALVFGIAAVAACWNPIAAPFGLVVGVVAIVLALRARRSRGRRLALAALALSAVATVASIVVLVSTAGVVSVELPGEPVVKGRTQAELDQVLSESEERTRARREQAIRELDALGGAPDAGSPAAARGRGSPRPDGGPR